MSEDYSKLVDKNFIYFLLIEPGFYKFGITGNIYSRLRTHARTLKFAEIVGIFECPSRQSSFRIEQKFKNHARKIGILVKKYEKTEIICTDEPQKYVEWFRREIQEEMESLRRLAITNNKDFVPRIPRMMPRFDARVFHIPRPHLTKPIKIFKGKRLQRRIENNVVVVKETLAAVHKCNLCGENFCDKRSLTRHTNRKNPCRILAVEPADAVNPNRCIHCNKILSKKEHLVRHLKTCKLKNGGIANIPDPNVRLAEQVRIMAEEREKEKEEQKRKEEEQKRKEEEQKRKDEEKDREIAELRAMIKDIMSRSIAPASLQVTSLMEL
jgi:hypothetical protein